MERGPGGCHLVVKYSSNQPSIQSQNTQLFSRHWTSIRHTQVSTPEREEKKKNTANLWWEESHINQTITTLNHNSMITMIMFSHFSFPACFHFPDYPCVYIVQSFPFVLASVYPLHVFPACFWILLRFSFRTVVFFLHWHQPDKICIFVYN